MELKNLKNKFERIGARIKVRQSATGRKVSAETAFTIDIGDDRDGEFFDLTVGNSPLRLDVINHDPADRHLLLLADSRSNPEKDTKERVFVHGAKSLRGVRRGMSRSWLALW